MVQALGPGFWAARLGFRFLCSLCGALFRSRPLRKVLDCGSWLQPLKLNPKP